MTTPLAYRRVLLKLSGEALMGDEDYGIDPKVLNRLAREVIEARDSGAEIALVIGGGNIFRGAGLAAGGMDRVTGDQMGMLATVINALAMQDLCRPRSTWAPLRSTGRLARWPARLLGYPKIHTRPWRPGTAQAPGDRRDLYLRWQNA